MNWEEILKNIQISSQKTSSRDYVLPDEDEEVPDVEQEDEDCRQWWKDLMDMCDELLDYVAENKYKKSGFFKNPNYMNNELLCKAKQEIIAPRDHRLTGRFSTKPDWYKYDFRVLKFGHLQTNLTFAYNTNDSNTTTGLRPTLHIYMSIDNDYIYNKQAPFMRDHDIADISGESVVERIISHIRKFVFRRFIEEVDGLYIGWGDSQDALEKSIQIGSQKTSSRDYVLPDGDDEDCFKWWDGLFKIIKRMILEVNSEYNTNTLDNINFKNLTNEYLCKRKEEILRNSTQFYSVVAGYLKYMGEHGEMLDFSASIDDYTPSIVFHVKLHAHVTPIKEEVFIQLEENTKDIKTYKYSLALELVKKFHIIELDLMDYLNINGDPRMTAKLIEIYDDYLREKFDVKKNIQISGQKTSSRDYVLPDDDDEDCREWWRQLHKIYNKMINAIDRNATIIIDNAVEKVDNRLLCELRDALLNEEIDSDFTFTQSYGHQIKYGKEVENKGGAYIFGISLAEQPNSFRSELHIVSEYKINGKYEALFNVKVPIWNDSILYELDRIKEKTGEGKLYAYSVVEPFLEAELEFKRHINDPNPSPYVASKLIHIYEKYLNSDVKKSINIAGQKTSSINYVVDDDERNCREEVLKIADKIMKFSYSDEFNMDNPVRESKYSKFYVKDYYQGMSVDEINDNDRLSLETHFIEKLDEETCCLILETIDKYKGQNLVEVEVKAPMTDGHSEGVFIYTKEIFQESCFIQIFFPSGKHIAATLSLKLDQKAGIPPDIIIEIEDIFESR